MEPQKYIGITLSETFTHKTFVRNRKKVCLKIYSNEDLIFTGEFTETLGTEVFYTFAGKL